MPLLHLHATSKPAAGDRRSWWPHALSLILVFCLALAVPGPAPGQGPEGRELFFAEGFESGSYFGWDRAELGAADGDAPVVYLQEPARPAVYNDDSPEIRVAFYDLDSEIDPASLRLELDGLDILSSCTLGADTASCPSGPLALGFHEITASLWDVAGNRGEGAWTFEVALDGQPPTVSIRLWDGAGPNLDVVYNDPTPVLNLDYFDELAGVDPQGVAVTVDGTVPVECGAGPQGAFCETPPLTAGPHQVVAEIEDYGGNPASAVFDFELLFDEIAPVVTLSMDPAAPRSGETLDVTITYSDAGLGVDLEALSFLVTASERIHLCTVGPTEANCQVPAGNPGNSSLEAIVRDVAGNETRERLPFAVTPADVVGPVVTLLAPAAGDILRTPDPELRFSVTDADTGVDPATVLAFLDSADVTAVCSEAGGVYSCPVSGLGRGTHELAVQAADLAGNGTTANFPLLVQLSLPIEVTAPADGTLFPVGAPADVFGTVGTEAVAVEVNGIPATLDAGTFAVQGLSLHEGMNLLEAVAVDAQGNVGIDSVEVEVDGTPPRLSIAFPRPGAVIHEASVTVSGMVHDPALGTTTGERVAVTVNGQSAAVSHRSFLAEGVPLVPGANVLAVEAVDLSGNTRTEAVEVIYDPAPANGRLIRVSGDLQSSPISSPLPEALVVQLVNVGGAPRPAETVVFEVTRGNGLLTGGRRRLAVETDGSGQALAALTLGSRAGAGVNRVEASVAGVGKVSFTATGEVGPPNWIHVVSGDGQRGVPGQELQRPLVVVVTDAGQNPVPGAEVSFEVLQGGGELAGGGSEPVLTDARGYASQRVVVGDDLGTNVHLVQAAFPDQPQLPALFQASAFLEGDPAETRISGVVLDNAGVPVPGYTLSLLGTSLTTIAGPAGEFTLEGAPVGHGHLVADGSTATRPGTWPTLEFEVFLLAGIDNPMDRPIYVLPLLDEGSAVAGGAEAAVVEIPAVPGFSLTVLPGSMTLPDGSTTGVVSATAVHADKVPMAPPEGMQPRFIVTIQPAGAHFDPPAPVTFPNVDGLAPGTVTEMFSFDHDLGAFVSIGTGTVSDDGTVVASDPGFGIVKAGWHCAAPQSGRGQASALSLQVEGPDPIILLAGLSPPDSKPITAHGQPPLDATYSWEVDNESIATIKEPSGCDDQTACTAEVVAGNVGQTTARVTFNCTTTEESEEKEIDIVVAKFQLAELSYSGEDYQEVADDVGTPYDAPHWQDNSDPPDGDASDPPASNGNGGDLRFPVSYRRGAKIVVSADFRVEPAEATFSSVLIRGTSPTGLTFPQTMATVGAGQATIEDVEAEEALEDVVAFHNPLTIEWEVSVDEGMTWAPAGTSENRVYVTLDEPAIGASPSQVNVEIYESVMELATRSASGARTQAEALAGIWQDFQDPLPGVMRKGIDGRNVSDGQEMNYWIDVSNPDYQLAFACQRVETMLDPRVEGVLQGVGTCRAWANLFIASLASHGIRNAKLMRVDTDGDLGKYLKPEETGLLVRSWSFLGQGTARDRCGDHYTFGNGVDLVDQVGVAGQGVPNPPGFFNFHFIVFALGRYYDPSYGSGPFSGTSHYQAWNTWENPSLSGFYQSCPGAGEMGVVGRKNDQATREVFIGEDRDDDVLPNL